MTILDRPDLLTPTEAARRLPGRPNRSTVWRWCSQGVLAPTGDRIRLKYCRLGRRVLIDPHDLEAFARCLADADQRARSQQWLKAVEHRSHRRAGHDDATEREADGLGS